MRKVIAAATLALGLMAAQAGAVTLYGANSNGEFYTIDPVTGVAILAR